MSSRRPPLHTCGISTIRIAMKVSAVAQNLNGPLGSMVKRVIQVSSPAIPFIHALLYLWLVLLSIADDHILALEGIVEKIFPSLKHVFDKIDGLIHVAEKLPKKFDCTLKRFPAIIHQVPFLDWALAHVISMLELSIAILDYWGLDSSKEKEILVDLNCETRDKESEFAFVDEHEIESKSKSEFENANEPTKSLESEAPMVEFPLVIESKEAEIDTASVDAKQDGVKSTYKEVLKKENTCIMRDQNVVGEEKTRKGRKKIIEGNERSPKGDHIIELFESSWLMKRGKRAK